jgi:nicotinamidase-related amidase
MALRFDPATTAVVTMELENGVVGPQANLADLRQAAEAEGTVANAVRIVQQARSAGIQIVHAVAEWRADRLGTPMNTPLAAYLDRFEDQIAIGTPASELVHGLGPEPEDLVSRRLGGLTPFTGTNLDALLRACDTRTIIAVGVSLNVGVLGMVIEAASLGYRIVVPSDAVVGVPVEYGHMVIEHSLRPLATITTTAELCEYLTSR